MGVLMAVWAFAKSPLGRYIALALLAASLFVGMAMHYRNQGKLEGKQEATDQFLQQQAKDKDAAHAEAQAHINADNAKDQASTIALNNALNALQAATATIKGLVAERKAGLAQVGALKDSELHPFTVRNLNLRPANDLTACYTPAEERAIAEAVKDDPLCRKQADIDDPAKFKAYEDAAKAQSDKLATAKDRYDWLAGYTSRLEIYYRDAYDAAERNSGNKFLRIVTFGIKGKAHKVTLPDPKQLAQETQETQENRK